VGQLEESGEYRMGRVRVVCFHVRSSKGGSRRLYQLMTTSVGPCGISIDYVLGHTGFKGSRNLSSFNDHRVGRYPTLPTGCTPGWCVGHSRMPVQVSRVRHALG
jgi:hypothetical protein